MTPKSEDTVTAERETLLDALQRLVFAIEDCETIRYRVLRPVREAEHGPSDDQEVIDALVQARAVLSRAAPEPRPEPSHPLVQRVPSIGAALASRSPERP